MKVISPKQMASIESRAFNEGDSPSEFMQEAGSGVALIVHEYAEYHDSAKRIYLLCGKGNNAGDAYVAGIDLIHLDYDVTAFSLFPDDESSTLARQNREKFILEGGHMTLVHSIDDLQFSEEGIIIDGIFGTGFQGLVTEPIASFIEKANRCALPIISIDIPSGLNGETGDGPQSIRAAETAFLELPKTGFFINDGWNVTGKLRYVNFGLDAKYIESAKLEMVMLTSDMLDLPTFERDCHKYERGYVVGVAGSHAYPGAALLSSWGAITSGSGIVRLMHPKGMEELLSSSPYEIIKTPYDTLEDIIRELPRASSLYIGPGLGLSAKTKKLVKELLQLVTIPCVVDADALTIISEETISLPPMTILTPHHGEMAHLLGEPAPKKIDLGYLEKCRSFAAQKNVVLVLKGGPTFILAKEMPIYVCPMGDPGMATAGSGDVLTGVIAALVAQKVDIHKAACLGVFLHGLAGEFAALFLTSYCLTASDIVEHLPEAFMALLSKKI